MLKIEVIGKPEGMTLDKLSKVLFGLVIEYIWGCRLCLSVYETEAELELHRIQVNEKMLNQLLRLNDETRTSKKPVAE